MAFQFVRKKKNPFDQTTPAPRRGKFSQVMIGLVVTAVVGFLAYYVLLPVFNLHAAESYFFVGFLCLVFMACSLFTSGIRIQDGEPRTYFKRLRAQAVIPLGIIAVMVVVFVIGSVISWPIFRAGAYRSLIDVKTGDFAAEVHEVSYNQIPLLDKDSAERLGDRKLGELSDMVSQFEVSNDYTQINYGGRPVRVTPLVYGDTVKWFYNRKAGLPASIKIDMVTQAVEVVRLPEGMKYSPSELFGRNLIRHLRFSYPTMMFDAPTFEIDDNGHPYWICPRLVKTIGLFGGTDIRGAVIMDAVTGESSYYEEIPTWVDRVYTAELIMEQYDYYGTLKNGFLNSLFGQKDVTVTTAGYNYIAMNDDVYVYTGITSVTGDESNIGFILSNQRTKETTFYPAAGAEEYSARSSAEGVVQHLGYRSTFPLLLNIAGEPTYFMSLKDNAQLVKMYAMVNVKQYQIVATGTTVAECERQYRELLRQNNVVVTEPGQERQVTGRIAEIREAVREGTSYYYFRLESGGVYYVISAADSELAVILSTGEKVTIEYDDVAEGEIVRAFSVVRAR